MIKLQNSSNHILPFSSLFSYHRLYYDYNELYDPSKRFPNEKCLLEFQAPEFINNSFVMNCAVLCKEGDYQGTIFKLEITVLNDYPFIAPRIKCLTNDSHPCIHPKTREVFIPILKETEWLPVYNMCSVFSALESVLVDPTPVIQDHVTYNTQGSMAFEEFNIFQEEIIAQEKNQFSFYSSRGEMGDGFRDFIHQRIKGDCLKENMMNIEYIFEDGALGMEYSKLAQKEPKYKFAKKRRACAQSLVNPDLKKPKFTPLSK